MSTESPKETSQESSPKESVQENKDEMLKQLMTMMKEMKEEISSMKAKENKPIPKMTREEIEKELKNYSIGEITHFLIRKNLLQRGIKRGEEVI